jgi:hypothetical protein
MAPAGIMARAWRLAHTLFSQERDPDPGGTVLSLMLTGRESPSDDLV